MLGDARDGGIFSDRSRHVTGAYAQALSETRSRFGDDPFISKLVDSIAGYAAARGWVKRTVTVPV